MKRLRGLGRGARARRGYAQDSALEEGGSDSVFTPLIDIFVSIVFFLMVGFTTAGAWIPLTPGVELPSAVGRDAGEGLRVGVTSERITLDDEPVIRVADAMVSSPPAEPYLIPVLYDRLRSAREEGGGVSRRRLVIQGDRRIPYSVLSRVVYSARRAGFETFDLHVVSEGTGGRPPGGP